MSEIIANHLKDKRGRNLRPYKWFRVVVNKYWSLGCKHMESADNIKYYAQELKRNTYNLTLMNLVMRGILPNNILIRNGNTLEEDRPYFDEADPVDSYNPLYVEAVVSNPPYSQP